MRSRRILPGTVLGMVAAAPCLIAATALAAGSPGRAPVSTAVGVSEREFRLTPYRTRVPAGEVRFNVTNYGEDTHDLVVRTAAGRVLRRSAEVRPGARATVALKLRSGTYRLSCDVADHAQRGMRATIKAVR